MKLGTIMDATLISASSSTKTKPVSGSQRCIRPRRVISGTSSSRGYAYGMKAHIAVGKDSGLIHSVKTTSADVHDITREPEISDKRITFRVSIKSGKRRAALPNTQERRLQDLVETAEAAGFCLGRPTSGPKLSTHSLSSRSSFAFESPVSMA